MRSVHVERWCGFGFDGFDEVDRLVDEHPRGQHERVAEEEGEHEFEQDGVGEGDLRHGLVVEYHVESPNLGEL